MFVYTVLVCQGYWHSTYSIAYTDFWMSFFYDILFRFGYKSVLFFILGEFRMLLNWNRVDGEWIDLLGVVCVWPIHLIGRSVNSLPALPMIIWWHQPITTVLFSEWFYFRFYHLNTFLFVYLGLFNIFVMFTSVCLCQSTLFLGPVR